MQPKTYKLSVLPLFEEDLNEIIDYITNELHNPDAAFRLVDDIEIAINERLKMPLAFAPYTCLEIDIPADHVLLSDFDAWSIILLHGLITDTEEEDQQLETEYESLSPKEQQEMKNKNWNMPCAFDTERV